jgi:hypothetical protein
MVVDLKTNTLIEIDKEIEHFYQYDLIQINLTGKPGLEFNETNLKVIGQQNLIIRGKRFNISKRKKPIKSKNDIYEGK